MKRYIFFLRHFNDIDNIVPAIYFFLKKDSSHYADVVIYSNDYDFEHDQNLIFLQKTFLTRIKIHQLKKLGGGKIKLSILFKNTEKAIRKILLCIFKNPDDSIYRFTKNVMRYLQVHLKEMRLSKLGRGSELNRMEKAIVAILESGAFPSIVVFDINRTGPVYEILKYLRARGVLKIVCLPVSPLINYNVMRETDFVNIFCDSFRKEHDYSGFDKLAYVDEHFIKSYNCFFNSLGLVSDLEGKTATLGAIRYCNDWLQVRSSYMENERIPKDFGKIKIVFFLSRMKSNVDVEELKRVFVILDQFKNIDVIIKPHTRAEIEDYYRRKNINRNYRDGSNIDSSSLIDWADAVLFWSTSVAIEGYMKNKTMICLKYLVSNKNIYDKYDAGLIARCRDDFFLGINQLLNLGKVENYNYNGANLLIRDIVYCGNAQNNIPEKYLDFLVSNEF